MSDDSKELSRVEDILSGEDYLPKKPMSRVEELLMDGAMVPKVDDTDNGKVLKVIDGEWQPGEDVSGDNLPPVSSLDNGKVLKVINGEWNMGSDNSDIVVIQLSASYPFSGSKVTLPANINSVLIANYSSSPKVPTFLVTSNNIIFEPKEVDVSSGTTPSVHIRWGRMYSTFDSATREQDIYNDSLSYNTQNQTTEASYFKTKAIQTIPPVDVPDSGKVMQVGNGGTWQANYLPEVAGVPAVEQADVGKVLKATDVGEYDWGDAPDPLPAITSSDNGKVLTARNSNWVKETLPKDAYFINVVFYGGEPILPTGLGITLADINPTIPVYLLNNTVGSDDNGKVYTPVFIDSTIVLGVKENAEWQCISTETVNGEEVTYVERIVYYMNADDQSEETVTYTKEELDIPDPLPAVTSADNGKVLKVVEGAWAAGADEGGSEAVYKTLAEYEALPTADKEDPTKIYFVINEGTKISPTLDANDGNCNATNAPEYAWWCLSGNASTEFQISEGGLSEYNSPAWWSYHFSTRQIFSKVKMRYRNNSSENRVRFSIQASNDGSTWNEILNGSPKYVDLTTENTDMEFVVDTGNVAYEYIRLRFDMQSGWEAGAIKICGNLEIYATANSSSPMIYYKNMLYTPNELPITSTSDTGKALVVNSDGVWDKGTIPPSVTPVEIEAEDYHALTTVEKEDPTKIYFVKAGRVITDPVSVIPRNPSSSNIDCNTGSASYNTSAAYAFDGVMNSPPDARATSAYSVSAWYPGYGNAPASAWASYHFDSVITNLVKLEVYAYNMATSDPSATFTTPVIVEGSTDGTTWFNILADGTSSFTLNSKETEFVKNVIPIDNTVSVSYIRLRFLNQINGYNDINFAIAEIYAYTGNVVKYDDSTYYKGIKHGKTVQELPDLVAADEGKVLKAVDGKWSKGDIYRELTQAEYDALPSSKNSDGIIYFITDNS